MIIYNFSAMVTKEIYWILENYLGAALKMLSTVRNSLTANYMFCKKFQWVGHLNYR